VYAWLAVVYLLILVVKIPKLFISYFSVQSLRSEGVSRAPGHLKIFLLDACAALGIRRKVEIWISNRAVSPLTFGFLKPVILLPVAALNNLSTQQVEAILLHEISHIRRNDYLVHLISRIVSTLMFFNPFIQALDRSQGMEREKSADDWVIRFDYNRAMYASALYALAKASGKVSASLAIPASGNKMELLNRIEWMMGKKERIRPGKIRVLTYTLTIIMSFLLMTLSVSHTPSPAQKLIASVTVQSDIPLWWAAASAPGSPAAVADRLQENILSPQSGILRATPGNAVVNTPPAQSKETTRQDPSTLQLNEPSPVQFVNLAAVSPMALSGEQEAKIEKAIQAARQIIAESNWKRIDQELGEALTTDEKKALKDEYMKRFAQADIRGIKQDLSLVYSQVNWDSTLLYLNAMVNEYKMDSVSLHYKGELTELKLIKSQLASRTPKDSLQLTTIATINARIQELEKRMKTLDSIRAKKITDL
jgi:beta-lactamase regulating signal transducer with metallopeptidase domain